MNPAAELLLHAGATFLRTAVSVILALAAALPAGILLGRRPGADRLFRPLVYLLYTVPKIALFPLAILLFGLNDAARIAVVSLVLFFQFLLAVRDGVRELPRPWFLVMASLGGSRRDRIFSLILPALVPRLCTALRIGTASALAVLFYTETSAVEGYGLGLLTVRAWMSLEYGRMALAAGAAALLGAGMFQGFRVLENLYGRSGRA